MNMVILKGSTMANFCLQMSQKSRNLPTSNLSTETTRITKNMVDTALDLPWSQLSHQRTLGHLQIKEKKFPLFEVFLTRRNHVFSKFWWSNIKMPKLSLSHTKMKITMEGSVLWKIIFETYILWDCNIWNRQKTENTHIKKLKNNWKFSFFHFFLKKNSNMISKKKWSYQLLRHV